MSIFYHGVLLAIMAGAAVVDSKHFIIPNKLILFGVLFSLAWALVGALYAGSVALLLYWAKGLLAGGAPIFLIILITRGGMGAGDMKLMAVVGAFLGWRTAFVVLFFSIIFGGAYATALLLLRKKTSKDRIPFGPSIAFACSFVVLFYPQIRDMSAIL